MVIFLGEKMYKTKCKNYKEENQKLTTEQIQQLFRKTLFNVDTKYQIFFDNIRCCNCDYDGLVEYSRKICPKCGKEGFLVFKVNQPRVISC